MQQTALKSAPVTAWAKRLEMGKDIFLLMVGMVKLVLNPSDISPIFKGRTFREHRSFQLALQSLKADPETAELIRTRYLAPAPYDLDVLMQLPEGTLGRVYAEHMRRNKLDVVFYPPLEDKQDDDISYMRKRARQTHDIHHVLLDFPAIDVGEMMISAFYLAQNRIPLSALLLGTGFFRVTFKEPDRMDEFVEAIIKGWTTGKQMPRKVLGVKWENYFDRPLHEVRAEMGLLI